MKRVKWGLVGCGDISRKRVAPALLQLENSHLIGISRAHVDRLAEFALEFSVQRTFRDWRKLIDDSEIDAVYVATPVNLHAPITISAADAGKHVLCEKPMAISTSECDEMIAACRRNSVQLGIAYYRHFYPVLKRIRELIQSGEIGQPVIVQMNAFEFYNPSPDDPRYWFLKKEYAGGGPMFDFGCHRIQVLVDLLGPIKETRSSLKRLVFEREVEDTATAILEFASGTQATITVTHAANEAQDTLDIYGTEGSIRVENLNGGTIQIITDSSRREEAHPPHSNLHEPLIDDFATAILEERSPAVGGEQGREVNRILSEIYGDS
jgi:predicted dehydrogenase